MKNNKNENKEKQYTYIEILKKYFPNIKNDDKTILLIGNETKNDIIKKDIICDILEKNKN